MLITISCYKSRVLIWEINVKIEFGRIFVMQ